MKRCLTVLALGLVAVAWAVAGTWPGGAITVNDNGASPPAVPYPSTVTVSGEAAALTKLTVSLTATHSWTGDLDLLLVGPTGARLMFLSDACGSGDWASTAMTFDDAAAGGLPESAGTSTSPCPGGTLKPTDWDASTGTVEDVALPQTTPNDPALNPPYPEAQPAGAGTFANTFNGTDPNGVWKLYAADDGSGDIGSIESWALNITSSPTAVGVRGFYAVARSGAVVLRWRTSSEVTTAGFDVFRVKGARTTRVNRSLVRAVAAGAARGAGYTLVDRNVRAGAVYTYRLVVVGVDGSRRPFGSSSLRAR